MLSQTLTPVQEAQLDVACYPWCPDIWNIASILAAKHGDDTPDTIRSDANNAVVPAASLVPQHCTAEMLALPLLAHGYGLQLKREPWQSEISDPLYCSSNQRNNDSQCPDAELAGHSASITCTYSVSAEQWCCFALQGRILVLLHLSPLQIFVSNIVLLPSASSKEEGLMSINLVSANQVLRALIGLKHRKLSCRWPSFHTAASRLHGGTTEAEGSHDCQAEGHDLLGCDERAVSEPICCAQFFGP